MIEREKERGREEERELERVLPSLVRKKGEAAVSDESARTMDFLQSLQYRGEASRLRMAGQKRRIFLCMSSTVALPPHSAQREREKKGERERERRKKREREREKEKEKIKEYGRE